MTGAQGQNIRDAEGASASVAAEGRQENVRELAADVALWAALALLLELFRGFLLVWFADNLSPTTGPRQILRCFATGFRFDARMVSYAVLPLAAFSLVGFFWPLNWWHRRARRWIGGAATLLCFAVFAVDVPYFKEYHDQFNHWVFDMGYDDGHAIAVTIWKTSPIVWLLLLVAALWLGIGIWGLNWWTRWAAAKTRVPTTPNGAWRIVLPVALAGALVVGLRGSAGRRPAQAKDAAVCGDVFLDKIVMNPFEAFYHAWLDYRTTVETPDLGKIWKGDIRAAARRVFPQAPEGADLDECTRRVAAGATGAKPRHVFLVVMESYDAWSMQPEFAALHLTDEMQALGREGLWIKAFVSAGSGTMPSLSTLISGLPELGLHINYRPLARQGVVTAIAPIFKRLGYRTRFFYGGYPSWQRLGDFCREQGFDEVHGGGEMSDHLTGNEWGVNDRDLFNFILKSTGDQPTFDMVMSTSDHPPFSVDLEKEGCPLRALPADLARYKASAEDVRIMGHLWYADRCLGEFVRAAQTNLSQCLFALTGDHYSRRCLNPHPDIFERRAVPLVLYGPGVLPAAAQAGAIAGSHLDILPTLIELCAAPGFEYHAFGRNLLDPSRTQAGFGAGAVVTPNMILEVDSAAGPESLAGQPEPAKAQADDLRESYRALHALSWWRVIRGSKF